MAEETLRRWLAAAALVVPHTDGGRVVVMADRGLPSVQALVRWDPVGHAAAELAARAEVGFPPAVRMAAVEGSAPPRWRTSSTSSTAALPAAEVLGPVELEPAPDARDIRAADDELRERALLRVPRARAGRWPPRCTPRRPPAPPARRPIRCGSGWIRPRSGDAGHPPGGRMGAPPAVRRSVSVQPVRLFGDPVLRTPAAEVTTFDAELRKLVADLTDTMHDEGGAGLAAPQLGVGLRVFTYDCDGFSGHLVNPTFDVVGDEEQLGPEGCLSIPGLSWECRRHLHVVARGWNQHGEPVGVEGSELLARCIQHETDHLDGVLFVDRLDAETRKRAMAEIRAAEWFGAPEPRWSR